MTLTELRYIVTLAQEQHFGHAAERCHVSQPTLSVGVKKLEDELGVLIFERSKSAVRVTPVGEAIVAQAQKVLEQAQGIRELAQAGKNQLTAPLKVGAIYTVGPYLFPHLIPQLHRVAPQMPLYIEENFTHVLRDKLRNGELDAIIIALPFHEADVLTLPLYDEPFYVLMPSEHPWTKKDTIDAFEGRTIHTFHTEDEPPRRYHRRQASSHRFCGAANIRGQPLPSHRRQPPPYRRFTP